MSICIKLIIAVLLLATLAIGQAASTHSQFSFFAQAAGVPGVEPIAVVGATYAVSPRWSLRDDNLLAAGADAYFGGLQYFLDSKKILKGTKYNPLKFEFYLTGSLGDTLTDDRKEFSFLLGGGVNYRPRPEGPFVLQAIEVRAARLPGLHPGVFAMVSSGLEIEF